MSFHLAVRHRYPGAIRQREYVSLATDALQRAGYRPDNTLVAVSHCRDELTSSMRTAIEAEWGPVFELAGLAGLLSAGTTGMAAALSHRPTDAERAGFAIFAFSHVGIDDAGTVGVTRRPSMGEPTSTCGSLAAVLAAAGANGAVRNKNDRLDVFDLEQWNVTQRVGAFIASEPGATRPDLADLADIALGCIEADIGTIFDRLVGHHPGRPLGVDGALFTGVHIHGPGDQHYIWPATALVDVDGAVFDALPETMRAAANEALAHRDAADPTPPESGRPRHAHAHRDLPRHQPDHAEHAHYDPARTHTTHRHTEHAHTTHERWDPAAERRTRGRRAGTTAPAEGSTLGPDRGRLFGRLWPRGSKRAL
ncbi:MAG: hypothetical protein AAF467_00915 [Actinomycetota bacterium]